METLDTKWIHIKSNNCERTESSPATLGLTNMAGVFIMIGMGLAAGAILTFVEVLCAKRRCEQKKKHELSTATIQQWRDTVQKRQNDRYFLNATDKQMQLCHNTEVSFDDVIHHSVAIDKNNLNSSAIYSTNMKDKQSNNPKPNFSMNMKEKYSVIEDDLLSTKGRINRKRKASDYSCDGNDDSDDGDNDALDSSLSFALHASQNNLKQIGEKYCVTTYRCDQVNNYENNDKVELEKEQEQVGQEGYEEEEEEEFSELIHRSGTVTTHNNMNNINHYQKSNIISAV